MSIGQASTSALVGLDDKSSFYAVDKEGAKKILEACITKSPDTYKIGARYSLIEGSGYPLGFFDEYGTIYLLKNNQEIKDLLTN